MPQITLEYTQNINSTGDLRSLLKQIHQTVHDVCGVNISNCKSRARQVDCFQIGLEGDDHGFVALDLLLLEGRDTEMKQAIGEAVLSVLKTHFADAMTQLECQLTVNVHDIEKATYAKHPSGSFTVQ